MPRPMINVIDHRGHDEQPPGEIIRPWMIFGFEDPGREYTDFCALYNAWTGYTQLGDPPEIIGFFGYRKYLIFDPIEGAIPAHAPNWWQCSKGAFDAYRRWLKTWDGAEIKSLLAQHDILQASPFPLTNGKTMMRDFQDSRSFNDALVLDSVVRPRFKTIDSLKIYPYLFITRWSVFDRMMREMEPLRQELHGRCLGADSENAEYKKRPMAYVMERVYSLWLENSGLSIKETPLLHCWEMS